LQELALHIVDIGENSIRAEAANIWILIDEDDAQDRIAIEIRDDGVGMDEETLERALDPFYTTKKVRRVGLGLPMLKEASRRAGGDLSLISAPSSGTRVRVDFQKSHWDRQPLGDVPGAIMTLVAGNPGINIHYRHECNGKVFKFETADIRDILGDVPLNNAEVLSFIKEYVREGLGEIGSSA